MRPVRMSGVGAWINPGVQYGRDRRSVGGEGVRKVGVELCARGEPSPSETDHRPPIAGSTIAALHDGFVIGS